MLSFWSELLCVNLKNEENICTQNMFNFNYSSIVYILESWLLLSVYSLEISLTMLKERKKALASIRSVSFTLCKKIRRFREGKLLLESSQFNISQSFQSDPFQFHSNRLNAMFDGLFNPYQFNLYSIFLKSSHVIKRNIPNNNRPKAWTFKGEK